MNRLTPEVQIWLKFWGDAEADPEGFGWGRGAASGVHQGRGLKKRLGLLLVNSEQYFFKFGDNLH